MAKISSAAEVLASIGGGMYLDKNQKADLHKTQAEIWVTHAVGEQDGPFGPKSVFHVKLPDASEARLAFGVSETRKRLAEEINNKIAQSGEPVGPFYLGRWENGNRSGWTLTADPTRPIETRDVEPDPPAPSFGIQKVIDESDDIPF
jgi:hypothetical protein